MTSLYSLHRSQLYILADRSIIQAKLYDLPAERIEFRHEELSEFLLEEVCQYLRTLVVAVSPSLDCSSGLSQLSLMY